MKVIFEADERGWVETRFEEAMALQETAARTGESEEALRRGMEWAAVNMAARAGVMKVQWMQTGGGDTDYAVGLRCDRYEVDLTGVPVLPADDRDLILGIVRVSPQEDPEEVLERRMKEAWEQQQTVQQCLSRIRELEVEIPALQALFARYAGVDQRPEGPERQVALKQRDHVFGELRRVLGEQYRHQVQLAWSLSGKPGIPPVGWAQTPPDDGVDRAVLCSSPALVRQRLLQTNLHLAGVAVQRELWRHAHAMPPEEIYQSRNIGPTYDDRYIGLLHDRYELEYVWAEQQKGESAGEIDLPHDVAPHELAEIEQTDGVGHLLRLFPSARIHELEATSPEDEVTFDGLTQEASDEARRLVKRLREIADPIHDLDRLLLWRAVLAQRLAGLLFGQWVEAKTGIRPETDTSIAQGLHWEELLADPKLILLRLVEIEVELARLAWMTELGSEDRSADLRSERDLLRRRLTFLEQRYLPSATTNTSRSGQKQLLRLWRDDVLENLLQLYSQAQKARLDARAQMLTGASGRSVQPLWPVCPTHGESGADVAVGYPPFADLVDDWNPLDDGAAFSF